MGLVNDLDDRIDEYLTGKYKVVEIDHIPAVDNISMGKKGYKLELCALYVDMRGSSDLLKGWKETSAKVHKAFLNVIAEVVIHYGGRIRDFQGDGILAFWATPSQKGINAAVKTAMVINWFLTVKFKKYFERYIDGGIDFGIGVHDSDAYIIRVGNTNKKENNDLVYISPSVNIAVELANRFSSPNNIGITYRIYNNLYDENKYHKFTDESGQAKKEDMWRTTESLDWLGKTYEVYNTNYYWPLNE